MELPEMLLALAHAPSVLAASFGLTAGNLLASPDRTGEGPVTLAKAGAATLRKLVALTPILLDELALLPHGR